MSRDLGTQETMSEGADFVVERRGFKLMAIAACPGPGVWTGMASGKCLGVVEVEARENPS
jgi:hypothetical protein